MISSALSSRGFKLLFVNAYNKVADTKMAILSSVVKLAYPQIPLFSSSLVPSYIVSESEVEASKEGRSLTDFKYACVGYSIYLDKNKDAPPTGDQKPRAELPVCVGIELLVDKRPADQPAHALNKEDDRGLPQHRPPKSPHPMGEEFLSRFTRNAGLVASGVAKNMRKVGNYVKESVDDILYRRPK